MPLKTQNLFSFSQTFHCRHSSLFLSLTSRVTAGSRGPRRRAELTRLLADNDEEEGEGTEEVKEGGAEEEEEDEGGSVSGRAREVPPPP